MLLPVMQELGTVYTYFSKLRAAGAACRVLRRLAPMHSHIARHRTEQRGIWPEGSWLKHWTHSCVEQPRPLPAHLVARCLCCRRQLLVQLLPFCFQLAHF